MSEREIRSILVWRSQHFPTPKTAARWDWLDRMDVDLSWSVGSSISGFCLLSLFGPFSELRGIPNRIRVLKRAPNCFGARRTNSSNTQEKPLISPAGRVDLGRSAGSPRSAQTGQIQPGSNPCARVFSTRPYWSRRTQMHLISCSDNLLSRGLIF